MVLPIAHIAMCHSSNKLAVFILVSKSPASCALICDGVASNWDKLNLPSKHDNAGSVFSDRVVPVDISEEDGGLFLGRHEVGMLQPAGHT